MRAAKRDGIDIVLDQLLTILALSLPDFLFDVQAVLTRKSGVRVLPGSSLPWKMYQHPQHSGQVKWRRQDWSGRCSFIVARQRGQVIAPKAIFFALHWRCTLQNSFIAAAYTLSTIGRATVIFPPQRRQWAVAPLSSDTTQSCLNLAMTFSRARDCALRWSDRSSTTSTRHEQSRQNRSTSPHQTW